MNYKHAKIPLFLGFGGKHLATKALIFLFLENLGKLYLSILCFFGGEYKYIQKLLPWNLRITFSKTWRAEYGGLHLQFLWVQDCGGAVSDARLHLQVYTCNPNEFREAVVQKLRTPCNTKLVPRQLEWKGDILSQKTTKEPEPSF